MKRTYFAGKSKKKEKKNNQKTNKQTNNAEEIHEFLSV